jgi:site-specific DNA-cytosine methylase
MCAVPCFLSQEKGKQNFLKHLAKKMGWEDMHIFSLLEHLKEESATCTMHGGKCGIPAGRSGPVIAHFGFSCKNLSRFAEAKGSTGSTFADIISALRVHPVPFIVFENVLDLMDLEDIGVILDAFQSVGMHAKLGIFESTDYGLPQ